MERNLFELVLVVKDIDTAARFYRDAVGLEPIHAPTDNWASFRAGPRETNAWLGLRKGTLLFEEYSPLPPGRRFGPTHFALRIPSEQKSAALSRLADHGVRVYGPHVWEPGRFEGESFYFYDPDANLVEYWFPAAHSLRPTNERPTSMIHTVKQLLTSQYHASLSTLAYCTAACPDKLWNAPVAKYPFSQVAFHVLIFADLYLGRENEIEFRKQPFHTANAAFFADYEQLEDREPVSVYKRPDILKYLLFVRDKAAAVIADETADSLAGPTGIPRRSFSRAELHVYNIRHIQHHSAQLILRLRLEKAADAPWFGAGWRDPAPASAS